MTIYCVKKNALNFFSFIQLQGPPKPYSPIVRGITYVGSGGSVLALIIGLGIFFLIGLVCNFNQLGMSNQNSYIYRGS